LSVADIARRLGLTPQGVRHHLRPEARPVVPAVLCRRCGTVARPAGSPLRERGPDLCPACLARQPGVPFGAVLRAYRLALGCTRGQLARRCGVDVKTLRTWEDAAGGARPRRDTLAKLAGVLGPELVSATAAAAGGRVGTRPPDA
jgi:hypothetical protein